MFNQLKGVVQFGLENNNECDVREVLKIVNNVGYDMQVVRDLTEKVTNANNVKNININKNNINNINNVKLRNNEVKEQMRNDNDNKRRSQMNNDRKNTSLSNNNHKSKFNMSFNDIHDIEIQNNESNYFNSNDENCEIIKPVRKMVYDLKDKLQNVKSKLNDNKRDRCDDSRHILRD